MSRSIEANKNQKLKNTLWKKGAKRHNSVQPEHFRKHRHEAMQPRRRQPTRWPLTGARGTLSIYVVLSWWRWAFSVCAIEREKRTFGGNLTVREEPGWAVSKFLQESKIRKNLDRFCKRVSEVCTNSQWAECGHVCYDARWKTTVTTIQNEMKPEGLERSRSTADLHMWSLFCLLYFAMQEGELLMTTRNTWRQPSTSEHAYYFPKWRAISSNFWRVISSFPCFVFSTHDCVRVWCSVKQFVKTEDLCSWEKSSRVSRSPKKTNIKKRL